MKLEKTNPADRTDERRLETIFERALTREAPESESAHAAARQSPPTSTAA
jgi:hypothetical protein